MVHKLCSPKFQIMCFSLSNVFIYTISSFKKTILVSVFSRWLMTTNYKIPYILQQFWNTVDSFFLREYLIGRFNRYLSNCKNINCERRIFIIVPFSLYLSEKLKRNFKIREMYFLRFLVVINSLSLIRYFQYDKTNSKFNEYELNICRIQFWLKKNICKVCGPKTVSCCFTWIYHT